MEIKISLDKSVEENAQVYFEHSKKAKKKLEGAKRALEQTKKKLVSEEKSHSKSVEKEEALIKAKQRKKDWFEKFKWFISSDGILVVGGKDASSNEVVIKKHADSWNLVFHTEAPGSPFVVVKNEKDQEVPEVTRVEAAVFVATHTKAWEKNMRSVEVFEAMPEQVTKEAKAGEFVSKGSFMIYGKRKIREVVLDLSIGYFLKDNHKIVMGGPTSAVSENCVEYLKLKQGNLKKGEISNKIMHKFGLVSNDDIISCLPPGRFDFSKK